MNLMSRVAVLAISAVPMYAQAQQSGVVKLKADAQNVVKIISGDKLKTQTYCEIAELDDEIDEEQSSLRLVRGLATARRRREVTRGGHGNLRKNEGR